MNDFLDEVIPELPDDVAPVFCVLTDAPSDATPWPPITERAMLSRAKRPDGRAFYMSTQFAKRNDQGEYRNRQQDFWGLGMLVLDDVGTKVDPNDLAPTYIIESSKGNFQWGYVLDTPLTDRAVAKQLVAAVYETPLTDGGGRLVNKFVRLPIGINGKLRDGERDTFKVRLVKSGGPLYTVDALVEGFGLVLGEAPPDTVTAPLLPEEEYRRVNDKVTEWLREQNMVLADAGGDWVDVLCPWHGGHSSGGDSAGYSPIGRGNMPDHRAFHCFHESCSERNTGAFLEWVAEQGGPNADVWDPIAPLVSRYVLLEYSSEVADTWASAAAPYPVVSLAAFRAANRQYRFGERGGKQYFGELWLEDSETVRCKGRVYLPNAPAVVSIDGVDHFNTFRPIRHPKVSGPPDAYLEHIDWLLGERAGLFHDWIAQKLQHPDSRSYALVLVADLVEGESGERYGTGRSTVGDILGAVFQAGVAKLSLSEIVGRGDSQSAYNDWAADTQLAIVEETKEEAGAYRLDLANYESIKKIVDTRPIPGVRVRPKYGRIFTTTAYLNFLMLTNHTDALQLPEDDRRFAVLDCAKGRRSFDEYAALQLLLRDPLEIARVYWWYMQRDVTRYDHIYPPMTGAKLRMIRQARGALDDVWDDALALLPHPLVTLPVLKRACYQAADGDEALAYKAEQMAAARFRKLDVIMDGWQLLDGKKKLKPRILREAEKVREMHRRRDFDGLRAALNR